MSAERASRVVSEPHIVPDAAATSWSVHTLNTSDAVVKVVLVAEYASAVHGRSGDPLTPGRGHTQLMGGVLTEGRRGLTIGALSLIRVPIFIFRKVIGRVASGVYPGGLGTSRGTQCAKKKVSMRNKNIMPKSKFFLKKKYKNSTNLKTVTSLTAGDCGVSGMSGRSSVSSSCWSGAPKAGDDCLLSAVGRGVSIGRIRLEEILGGLSGRGAAAGVWVAEIPLVEKLRRQEIPSTSMSSSRIVLGLTFLKKGVAEWGRTTPRELSLLLLSLPPYPSSQGGAEGCTAGGVGGSTGYNPWDVLAVTRKNIIHYKSLSLTNNFFFKE